MSNFFNVDKAIPKIHVIREQGQVVCVLDNYFRFGRVLLKNNKQGRHLFSIGYCIYSMAAKYSNMTDQEIYQDLIHRFHYDFLTMIVINSKYRGVETHFLNHCEPVFTDIELDYDELKNSEKEIDIYALQNYLNVVGVLLHTFPCNLAFAENASDPSGGYHAMSAIKKIPSFLANKTPSSEITRNIGRIIDKGVIAEVFRDGFDEDNIYMLAFMIMQLRELQSLVVKNEEHINETKIAQDLYEITQHTAFKTPSLNQAIGKSVKIIESIKREVKGLVDADIHKAIKRMVKQNFDHIYIQKVGDSPSLSPVR